MGNIIYTVICFGSRERIECDEYEYRNDRILFVDHENRKVIADYPKEGTAIIIPTGKPREKVQIIHE